MTTVPTAVIIGISGVSDSGKTEVTHFLSNRLNGALTMFWDDFESLSEYPPDYVEWHENSGDHTAWETPHLATTLETLKQGQSVTCPATGKSLQPNCFVVYDAPLGRDHEETGKYIDFLVFLDVPPNISLIRRLKRDYLSKNSFDAKAMKYELEQYETEVRPLFLDVDSLKQGTDLVVDGMQHIDCITETILSEIHLRYGTEFNDGKKN